MKHLYLALFLGLFLQTIAQTPCVDGMAGIYPCDGVTLTYHMTMTELGDAPGVNDIWGWTDPLTCQEYALVGRVDGTAFVDITEPLNPAYLGFLPTHADEITLNTWRDIKVYDNHAFIVSELGGHGMQVFDLTRLRNVTSPETFDEDAHYAGFGNCHNIVINEQTGFAYPVGTGQVSGGPLFVNIQDPLNPTPAGGYPDAGYCHDAQVIIYNGPDTDHAGKEIYLGAHGSNGTLVILDVSDKADPDAINIFSYSTPQYGHQCWITPDHRYVLLNDELDELNSGNPVTNTRTRIIDVTDLDNPVELDFFESPTTASDHNLYTRGDHAFLSNYQSGLRILDYSDINAVEEVAYFDLFPSDDNPGFSGTWSNYPYFESGQIIVTHRTEGLFIVDPEDPAITSVIDPNYMYECVPLGLEEESFVQFSMNPNPANDFLNIQSEELFSQVEILDLQGRIISVDRFSPTNIRSFDTNALEQGIYLVRVDNSASQRLVVQ